MYPKKDNTSLHYFSLENNKIIVKRESRVVEEFALDSGITGLSVRGNVPHRLCCLIIVANPTS